LLNDVNDVYDLSPAWVCPEWAFFLAKEQTIIFQYFDVRLPCPLLYYRKVPLFADISTVCAYGDSALKKDFIPIGMNLQDICGER